MNSLGEVEERLREAACIGNEELIREVLQNGVDVNSKNSVNGWTALHWAAKRGHTSVVSILLANGARKDIGNDKGELPVDVASSREIILVLGGDVSDLSERRQSGQNLPIVPNYMSNPVFPYVNGSVGKPSTVSPYDQQGTRSSQIPSQGQWNQPQVNELVLKVRVANAAEIDFIEIELQRNKLTFENLLNSMSQELQVHRSLVTKVRKLPDTILRKDKDVERLKDFQEVEMVLSNKYISESSRNYKPAVSPIDANIVY